MLRNSLDYFRSNYARVKLNNSSPTLQVSHIISLTRKIIRNLKANVFMTKVQKTIFFVRKIFRFNPESLKCNLNLTLLAAGLYYDESIMIMQDFCPVQDFFSRKLLIAIQPTSC